MRLAAGFAVAASASALACVVVLLLPRAIYLHRTVGAFVLTSNASGGALWTGLGEIPNPWNIPNPENGDQPIDEFARAHGYRGAFASARSSAFFRQLFIDHVRERPWFLARLFLYRGHRVLIGSPPTSVMFRGDYEAWPQMRALGDRLAGGTPWYRVLVDREYGPWFLKIVMLRWLGSALLWLMGAAAAAGLWQRRPLLVVPALAYAIGVGVFVLVHWSFRYGQQFYWLGYLSVYLLSVSSEPARTR
jgi:hypothetical protein